MNRIKIIISILCLTMATVVFSCKEDELIGCECLPYTYKIKLLKTHPITYPMKIYISSSVAKDIISQPQNPRSHSGKKPITCLRGTMGRIIFPNRWIMPKSILEKQTFCIR